ncbi:paramyosin-like [Anopheles merus]|uniref:paramyosin-like n=1 Tax=Anopheles merus TaxID=30066 RepID=UPI001BE481F7|nr:paramyosin-like [Anopheles merus]
MSDSQQSPSADAGKQAGGGTYNDILENIRELIYKDKSTIMVKAVELQVRNVHQDQEIKLLMQTLQDAIQQKEQMNKDVHDQPVIESFMANIEAQNSATRKQLQEKVESINVHIKSSEMLRKQLKKESVTLRFAIDDLRRRIDEKEEEGKNIHDALAETAARAQHMTKQRSAVSAEMAKLREECQLKMAEMRKMAASYEESAKKTQAEMAERSKEMEHCEVELAKAKQKVAEKVQAFEQLQTEKATLQQRYAELKKNYENKVERMERCFLEEKTRKDGMFTELNNVNQCKVTELEQSIANSKSQSAQKQRCAGDLHATVLKLALQLEAASNRNKELKTELEKLKTGGLEANGAGKQEPPKNKPNLLAFGRPKAFVFSKNANPAPDPAQSATSNTESSFHMDNDPSFLNSDTHLEGRK